MISAKMWQRVAHRDSRKALQEFRKLEYMPLKEVREYQLRKIQRLVHHSYATVPFYKAVFDDLGMKPSDIRSLEDFALIPPLDKGIIKDNSKDMISNIFAKSDLIPNSTGGSTGEPLNFFQDKNYETWANAGRIWGWYNLQGFEIGESCGVLWGAMRDIKVDFTLGQRIKEVLTTGDLNLNAFNLNDERKRAFLSLFRLIKPKILRGYVSAIKDLASFINENNEKIPFPDAVILCAENVDENTREIIEKTFQASTFNTYGGRELSLIAAECCAHDGLHEVSANNYVEYEPIKIEGHPDASNLIITNLNNYAMPFLRYRIGDIGVPGGKSSCTCGRELPKISKVIGRTTEIFIFEDGTKIAGEMFIHLMKDFNINLYQFVQKSGSEIVLNTEEQLSEDLKKNIIQAYAPFLPKEVRIRFDKINKIAKTSTGKFKFVYSEIAK